MSQHFPRLHFFLLELAILIRFRALLPAANWCCCQHCSQTFTYLLSPPCHVLPLTSKTHSIGREGKNPTFCSFSSVFPAGVTESPPSIPVISLFYSFIQILEYFKSLCMVHLLMILAVEYWKLIFHAAKIFQSIFHTRQIHRICNINVTEDPKDKKLGITIEKYTFT